jgi:hypothetical protein
MMRWLFQDGSDSDQVYAQKVLNAIGAQALQIIVPYIWVHESAFVVEYYSRRDQLAHDPWVDQLTWLFDSCAVVRGRSLARVAHGLPEFRRNISVIGGNGDD